MFTPFAVEAPIFGLYKLFKAEVEAIGWQYDESFTAFDKSEFKEYGYSGFYFCDEDAHGAKDKPNFVFTNSWDRWKKKFTLPQQWNEAIAHAKQQYNLLTGFAGSATPESNFESFEQPADLERGDTVRFKSGGGIAWLVESVNMDVAFLVATRTLYNAVEWERLKKPTPAASSTAWQPIETAPKDGTWIVRPTAKHFLFDGYSENYEVVFYDIENADWQNGKSKRYGEDRFEPVWMPQPQYTRKSPF